MSLQKVGWHYLTVPAKKGCGMCLQTTPVPLSLHLTYHFKEPANVTCEVPFLKFKGCVRLKKIFRYHDANIDVAIEKDFHLYTSIYFVITHYLQQQQCTDFFYDNKKVWYNKQNCDLKKNCKLILFIL